jgi:hypothetical protein
MANTYCCVYSVEILLMMDSGPVQNMWHTLSNKSEELCILLAFIIRIYHDARSSEGQINKFCISKVEQKKCYVQISITNKSQVLLPQLYQFSWHLKYNTLYFTHDTPHTSLCKDLHYIWALNMLTHILPSCYSEHKPVSALSACWHL